MALHYHSNHMSNRNMFIMWNNASADSTALPFGDSSGPHRITRLKIEQWSEQAHTTAVLVSMIVAKWFKLYTNELQINYHTQWKSAESNQCVGELHRQSGLYKSLIEVTDGQKCLSGMKCSIMIQRSCVCTLDRLNLGVCSLLYKPLLEQKASYETLRVSVWALDHTWHKLYLKDRRDIQIHYICMITAEIITHVTNW